MSHPTYTHDLRPDITVLKPGQFVLDAFPELAAYPPLVEHGSGSDGDPLLRFALFFASKGSGLLHLEPARKKEEALRLAGIGEDDARYADILAWRHEGAVRMVNQVIRLHNDLDYTVWFHMGLRLYMSSEKMSAVINGDDKGSGDKEDRMYILAHDLLDRIYEQKEDYKALTSSLFMSDADLAKASEQERLRAAGAVGQRARTESFVTKKRTLS